MRFTRRNPRVSHKFIVVLRLDTKIQNLHGSLGTKKSGPHAKILPRAEAACLEANVTFPKDTETETDTDTTCLVRTSQSPICPCTTCIAVIYLRGIESWRWLRAVLFVQMAFFFAKQPSCRSFTEMCFLNGGAFEPWDETFYPIVLRQTAIRLRIPGTNGTSDVSYYGQLYV